MVDSNSPSLISLPAHDPVTRPGRLAVLASGRGTNFARILDACDDGTISAEVVGLVHNRMAGCATIADDRDVERAFVDHRDFDTRADFDAAVVEELRAFQPDLVVMAGWMRIATETLVSAFPDRLINVHPSLLPAFRGIDAVEQALDAGVRISGCTVHIVRLKVDDGPIIGQAAVPVLVDDDAERLHARIQQAEYDLYPLAIEAMLASLD